jgi:hypothetical protein
MADGTIRVGTKIDFSGVKADIKAFEKELATIQKEADKLNAREKEVTDRYNEEREYDKQFPAEMSHREQIDEKYSKQLDPIIKDRETLNQKAQEYNALLEEANAKLQQQSAISQADKELAGAVKTAGALDKIQTEEQYQSMLARTKAQLERISAEAEKIAQKHGLSKEQLLSNNAEYQKLSDLLTQLEGKQGQFGKTAEKSMKKAQKSTSAFGRVIKQNIKQIAQMGLAIFGVRGAFMAMRRAANAYLESNQQLKSQMESLWNIAGQAIGPVIEWLIKGISTLVMWVNSLVQALTGVNLIAKANAAALKKQASAAKSASASLAGFDEMNKLSDSSGSGGSTGVFDTSMAGGVPQFLEDIKKKILEGDWFGAGEIAGQAIMDGIMNIDWVGVGDKIGDILGGIISFVLGAALNIDPFQLVGAVNGLVAGLFESISATIQKLDWVDIGGKLVKALLFGVLMADPATALLTIILSPNGDRLVSGAFELIGSIIGALISAIYGMGKEIANIAIGLWNSLKTYFDEYVDWGGTPGEIIDGLLLGIWEAIKNIGKWIHDNIWIPFRDGFKKAFDIRSPSHKMAEFGGLLIDGLCSGITGAINKVKQACTDIWNAIKSKFSSVGSWFKNTFSDAWQKVKDVFSTGGKIFDGIKDGIASTFKTIVNGLITGINKIVKTPFDKINGMLNTIRGISILGVSPFKNLWSYNPISVPQIPKLALGGIVNRPGRGVPAIIGEAGAEAVLPLENNTEWMDMLAEKIGGDVTIPIYMDGKKIATYVVDIQKKKAFAMNGA